MSNTRIEKNLNDAESLPLFDPKKKKCSVRKGSYGTTCSKHGEHHNDDEIVDNDEATFYKLLSTNRSYVLYYLSFLSEECGSWFSLVASISAVKQLNATSQTAVSILFILRLVPNILFSSLGGVLADAFDKRHVMIALNCIGMVVVLLYIPVIYDFHNLSLLYGIIFCQASIAGLYEPARKSIVPFLVPQEDYLKKAVTLGGIAFSSMSAIGAMTGGFVVSMFGMKTCFKIDALTYLMSTFFLWMIRGSWKHTTIMTATTAASTTSTSSCSSNRGSSSTDVGVSSSPSSASSQLKKVEENSTKNDDSNNIKESNNSTTVPLLTKQSTTISTEATSISLSLPQKTNLLTSYLSMTMDGIKYLCKSDFGPYVLFKVSASTFGLADPLNVSFSHHENDPNGDSRRLGMFYSCVGMACFAGPIFADRFTSMSRPRSLQSVCVLGLAFVTTGFAGWGMTGDLFHSYFPFLCFFTIIRAMGSAICWVCSTLLIQKFSSKQMLGRVTSVDYALVSLGQSFWALLGGILPDSFEFMTDATISWCASVVGCLIFLAWWLFHIQGRGPAGC